MTIERSGAVRTHLANIVAGVASAMHLYWAATGLWSTQRLFHVALFLALAFLIYPTFSKARGAWRTVGAVWDWSLIVLVVVVFGYTILDYDDLQVRSGALTSVDVAAGLCVVALVLEATWRSIGKPIMLLACIFLVYDYFGPHFPGLLGHKGLDIVDIVDLMYATTDGIFGVPVSVMASYVTLFMIFGALLEAYGAGEFFLRLSTALAGRFTGGPAKVAVISSLTLGTISGSAVANVVTTGTLTIPLMKRLGFQPPVAGAVESVASTGGMLMPPVMGAAAFVLADIVGIPYYTLVIAAIIPGILYYVSLFAVVHFYSVRHGIKGMDRSEVPALLPVLKEGAILFVPIVVLIHQLFTGRTPSLAVFWAIVSIVVVGTLHPKTRQSPRQLWDALVQGGMQTVGISLACACAGIIIGVVNQSGVALKFGSLLIGVTGGSVLFVLVITMVICLIFGMGLPATASYLTTAVLAAPALTELGVSKIAAHLFIFYFANLSAITPPVMLACFAAAGIAGSNVFAIGYHSVRFSVASYSLPFLFVYQPALLILGVPGHEVVLTTLGAAGGFVALAYAIVGLQEGSLFDQWERPLAFVAALGFMTFDLKFMLMAMVAGLVVAIRVWQRKYRRIAGREAAGPSR